MSCSCLLCLLEAAFAKASRMGKPDPDVLRWALNTFCMNGGDIVATFAAMGDDPAEAPVSRVNSCTRPPTSPSASAPGTSERRREASRTRKPMTGL